MTKWAYIPCRVLFSFNINPLTYQPICSNPLAIQNTSRYALSCLTMVWGAPTRGIIALLLVFAT
jgi:hypothetical protein